MPRAQRGSVLLPLIAGMLLMLYAGSALTELFSAQRMRAHDHIRSAQAFWAAEAGAWHAAQMDVSISTPVSFAGGLYIAVRDGDSCVSLADHSEVRRLVNATLVLAPMEVDDEGGGALEGGLIDSAASAATSASDGANALTLSLVSIADDDLQLEAIELEADQPTPNLREVRLDGNKLLNNADEPVPTDIVDLDYGWTSQHIIDEGDDPTLRLLFRENFANGAAPTFYLVLHFADGSADSVTFSVTFGGDR